jgi:hypothetical protein
MAEIFFRQSKIREGSNGTICTLTWREFESVSKGAVELCEFEYRQGGNKVSQFAFEHQGKEITANRAGARQAVFRPQHDFGCEAENFPVNGSADHSRYIFVFGNKSSGDDDVKSGLRATLGNPLACVVDLSSPHGRACSDISTRACRARRLRCFRKIAPSLASVARLRSLSAYWRSAARTSAPRLRRREDLSVSLSKSFEVASSIAIVFMRRIISAMLDGAQALRFVPLSRAD